MPEGVPVVAIDGVAGAGKGTAALGLARALGWRFLDSGALYRAAAAAALDAGADLADAAACARAAAAMRVELEAAAGGELRLRLAGRDAGRRLRAPEVGAAASRLAAYPGVRQALLARQRACRRPPGLVADGRDMGSVVFPDACLKVFLTAALEERARRRQRQLKEAGINATLGGLVEDLQRRDRRDTQRGTAPLLQSADAVVIDTTERSADDVQARLRQLLAARLRPPDSPSTPTDRPPSPRA